ncbi:MAG: hypothetical protein ACOVOR_02245 [Rhabdochlamydiaceae bacterium]
MSYPITTTNNPKTVFFNNNKIGLFSSKQEDLALITLFKIPNTPSTKPNSLKNRMIHLTWLIQTFIHIQQAKSYLSETKTSYWPSCILQRLIKKATQTNTAFSSDLLRLEKDLFSLASQQMELDSPIDFSSLDFFPNLVKKDLLFIHNFLEKQVTKLQKAAHFLIENKEEILPSQSLKAIRKTILVTPFFVHFYQKKVAEIIVLNNQFRPSSHLAHDLPVIDKIDCLIKKIRFERDKLKKILPDIQKIAWIDKKVFSLEKKLCSLKKEVSLQRLQENKLLECASFCLKRNSQTFSLLADLVQNNQATQKLKRAIYIELLNKDFEKSLPYLDGKIYQQKKSLLNDRQKIKAFFSISQKASSSLEMIFKKITEEPLSILKILDNQIKRLSHNYPFPKPTENEEIPSKSDFIHLIDTFTPLHPYELEQTDFIEYIKSHPFLSNVNLRRCIKLDWADKTLLQAIGSLRRLKRLKLFYRDQKLKEEVLSLIPDRKYRQKTSLAASKEMKRNYCAQTYHFVAPYLHASEQKDYRLAIQINSNSTSSEIDPKENLSLLADENPLSIFYKIYPLMSLRSCSFSFLNLNIFDHQTPFLPNLKGAHYPSVLTFSIEQSSKNLLLAPSFYTFLANLSSLKELRIIKQNVKEKSSSSSSQMFLNQIELSEVDIDEVQFQSLLNHSPFKKDFPWELNLVGCQHLKEIDFNHPVCTSLSALKIEDCLCLEKGLHRLLIDTPKLEKLSLINLISSDEEISPPSTPHLFLKSLVMKWMPPHFYENLNYLSFLPHLIRFEVINPQPIPFPKPLLDSPFIVHIEILKLSPSDDLISRISKKNHPHLSLLFLEGRAKKLKD